MKGLSIEAVAPGSVAAELGLQPGDRLLKANGRTLRDIIDYSYYCASEEELLLEVSKPDGEIWELEIERSPEEPLGLSFPPPQPARCRNRCVFCFVHQLPKGLRRPLYVKDEDYRLSFLNGNYVTLANITPAEMKRIRLQRLSPLYVSVHATSEKLRRELLGNQAIPPIMEQLRLLADAGIRVHTQVVLCPGLNDGAEFERTVTDLASLYPSVQSLAVVPVGLTSHRKGLPLLKPVDAAYAEDFIRQWQPRSADLARRLGSPFLFLADEFFLKAGLAFPPLKEYGELPQIENGVGMVPLFMHDAVRVLRRAKPLGSFTAGVVTGVSAERFVSEFLAGLAGRTGVDIQPLVVENRLFGSAVTVTGLVPGRDIADTVAGKRLDCLLVPDVMLKEGEGLFLDGLTVAELEQQAGCRVVVFDSSPAGCLRALRKAASGIRGTR